MVGRNSSRELEENMKITRGKESDERGEILNQREENFV